MRICAAAFLLPAFTIVPAADRPTVYEGGVLNAASYARDEMPNEGIAQGSMFVVFGSGMGPVDIHLATGFPLQPMLAGTSIRVTSGGVTTDAIMLYTSAGQAAAILPSSTPVGAATLTLTYNGQASNTVAVRIVKSNFGIFTANQRGYGPAVVQNWSSAGVALNSPLQAAATDQVLILWGTGLGPVGFDETVPPQVGPLETDIEVWAGGRQAKVLYKGRSAQFPGIDQINLELPPGAATGCYVPIAVRAAGVLSNVASVSVAQEGSVCSDPHALSSDQLRQLSAGGSLKIGWIHLLRVMGSATAAGLSVAGSVELGWADFFRMIPGAVSTSDPLTAWAGLALDSCTVGPATMSMVEPSRASRLNVGSALRLTGPKGLRSWLRARSGLYSRNTIGYQVQPEIPGTRARPLYLDPGTYTVDNASGGPGLAPFLATLPLPRNIEFTWTVLGSSETIDRSQDLTVTWTGGDPAREYVLVAGMIASLNTPSTEKGMYFACAGRMEAGRLTVPSWILSALPASAFKGQFTEHVLSVIRMPLMNAWKFTAAGLDAGYFTYAEASARTVTYK